MATAVTREQAKQVARPLKVLVPLIKKDLEEGLAASERAGLPYYQAAGEKIIEAKAQLQQGEFTPWIKRNLQISETQAKLYMSYARATSNIENGAAAPFASLDDFKRRHLGHDRPQKVQPQPWHDPVKQIISRVDVATLNIRQDELKKAEDRAARRELALQLIDIGFKALATKLHPDKGGSREAMARLNQVRNDLKDSIRY